MSTQMKAYTGQRFSKLLMVIIKQDHYLKIQSEWKIFFSQELLLIERERHRVDLSLSLRASSPYHACFLRRHRPSTNIGDHRALKQ